VKLLFFVASCEKDSFCFSLRTSVSFAGRHEEHEGGTKSGFIKLCGFPERFVLSLGVSNIVAGAALFLCRLFVYCF